MVLKKYPGLREFHTKPPFYATHVHLSTLVAGAFNATLFSVVSLTPKCLESLQNVPRFSLIFPLRMIKNFYSATSIITPALVPMVHSAFNFAYCCVRKKQQENVSPLEIFKSTADCSVWLSLLFSWILTGILMKVGTGRDYMSVILTTLSAILCPGLSGEGSRSKLFILWTFVCLLFVNYYSGSLTSVVISPAPDIRMTKVSELSENDYSIISPSEIQLKEARLRVNNSRLSQRQMILRNLLAGTELIRKNLKFSFAEKLASAEKTATFSFRATVIHEANLAMEYFTRDKITNRRCYVGQELELQEVTYFVASPTENYKLYFIYMRLVEAGFNSLWMEEFFANAAFRRIQDRSRSDATLTKIIEEQEPAMPLEISEGKLINVFLLWGVALVCCMLIFILEKIFFCGAAVLNSTLEFICFVSNCKTPTF